MLTLAEMTLTAERQAPTGRLAGSSHLHREQLGLEAEIRRLRRERSLARFETQLLNEIMHRESAPSAAEALLRRLVPQPSLSFAVLVDVSQTSSRWIASRGLSGLTSEPPAIPHEILKRLQIEPWIAAGGTADVTDFVSNLLSRRRLFAGIDSGVTDDVRLVGIGDGSNLAAVLITNSHWPAAVPHGERLDMLSRVGRTLARLLVRDRELKQRDDELLASREMLALRTITDRASDRPLETLDQFACRIREAVAMERASIFLLSRRTKDVSEPVATNGLPQPATIEAAWREHESKLAWHTLTHQRGGLFESSRLRMSGIDTLIGSAVTWPLVHADRLIGAIVLSRSSNQQTDNFQNQLLRWSADLLAATLRRLFDEAVVRRQARHDGLTDLTNRRTFDTLLAGEVDRVRLGLSSECSLLLADLDRFKSINDTHGHPAGDEVLRVVAQLLREHVGRMRVGERSVLARYGGEELAVLLPGVGLGGAMRLAEEIRQAVEQRVIPYQSKSLGVTISIGTASCPRHAMTPTDIISAADQALYRAKSEGRNRVCQPADR